MKPSYLPVRTTRHTEFIDVTAQVNEILRIAGIDEGVCYLYVPHTTAGVTINENADPSVVEDMIRYLEKTVPWNDNYLHLEGNSAAHIKSSLLGNGCQVFVSNGRLMLGTWQGILFCEFDGPRDRKIYVKIISA